MINECDKENCGACLRAQTTVDDTDRIVCNSHTAFRDLIWLSGATANKNQEMRHTLVSRTQFPMRCNASREANAKSKHGQTGTSRNNKTVRINFKRWLGTVWKCVVTRRPWKLALYRTSSSPGNEFRRAPREAF